MGGLLRRYFALGLVSIFAIPVISATAAEPTYFLADYRETCSLPSVASGFASAEHGPIQLASSSEAAGDSSYIHLCGDYNSCCEASCDCGHSHCCDCDCCCEPAWYFSGGAVFLQRQRPKPTAIITPPTGTPGTTVSGSDFAFDFDAGPEIIIAKRFDGGLVLEARYFNDRDASATDSIPQITSFRVAGIGVTILGGGSINSTYTTKLDSTELNVKMPLSEGCDFLVGFRAVELHDRLRSDLATPATFVEWDDNNHLYGGQLGLDMNMYCPGLPLRFDGVLKAGIFGNSADNVFRSTIVGRDRDTSNETAFVGEIDFTASYQFTKHIAARGGYMVMWIDQVALASESATTTVQVPGGTSSPVNTGDVFYNGAIASLEFTW